MFNEDQKRVLDVALVLSDAAKNQTGATLLKEEAEAFLTTMTHMMLDYDSAFNSMSLPKPTVEVALSLGVFMNKFSDIEDDVTLDKKEVINILLLIRFFTSVALTIALSNPNKLRDLANFIEEAQEDGDLPPSIFGQL